MENGGVKMTKEIVMQGRCITPGIVEGEAIVTSDAISFMGSVNPKTGYIIERKHELEGQCVKGKILVFPCSKGSTGGSYMLYDLVKNGCGPLGIINSEPESIVVIGSIVAELPMVVDIDITQIKTGDHVKLDAEKGIVRVIPKC
jgi:predicted aconitase with swiveling domain